ncbi:helix-turn-helix domain-containing protein [Streptomyces sp. 8N706]|uniref:helix-turn-helix domain-containing protein n=1 Tax=Streptomyces sp. 8N706 TaxID=3457416 RepID=UPI003FD2EA4A
MTKREPLVCGYCRRKFKRPKPTGRIPLYCSSKCRSANHRERAQSPARSYDEDVIRISRALLTTAQALAHTAHHQVPALPLALIQHLVAMQRDLDDFRAVAIRQAQSKKATWPQIAKVLNTSPSTLKSNYSAEKVDTVLERRAERGPARKRRPAVPGPRSPARTVTAAGRSRPGPPGYALSCALSHLQRGSSGLTARELAVITGVSTSYVYRIMSGERIPSWDVVVAFAHACEAEPDDLVFLWNKAHGLHAVPPPTTPTRKEAIHTLQAALRGLHLAAARPEVKQLTGRGHPGLTDSTVTALLHSPAPDAHLLRWPLVQALTTALQGEPQEIRPLFDRVTRSRRDDSDGQGPTLPASAFG